MTKDELFEKYNIDESHNVWEAIDHWTSVEIYRIMHDGRLPKHGDYSLKYIIDFLELLNKDINFYHKISQRPCCDLQSYLLTSKRMIRIFADNIILDIHTDEHISKNFNNPNIIW